MNPANEPRSPGVKRKPMISQPLDSNPPIPTPACITNEDLWVEVQGLKGTTREILVALKGNNLGTKGLIPRVEDAESGIKENAQQLKKQKNKVAKWAAFAAGVAFAAGLLKDWLFHKAP